MSDNMDLDFLLQRLLSNPNDTGTYAARLFTAERPSRADSIRAALTDLREELTEIVDLLDGILTDTPPEKMEEAIRDMQTRVPERDVWGISVKILGGASIEIARYKDEADEHPS